MELQRKQYGNRERPANAKGVREFKSVKTVNTGQLISCKYFSSDGISKLRQLLRRRVHIKASVFRVKNRLWSSPNPASKQTAAWSRDNLSDYQRRDGPVIIASKQEEINKKSAKVNISKQFSEPAPVSPSSTPAATRLSWQYEKEEF
jgi:hypothetical protein